MAIALAMGFVSSDASALALGRLNVQSALGEPLRAEIDVTDISPAEAEGLKVSIGSPESFKTSGMPYSPALSDLRVSLQRRADGRYVVRLNGSRVMNDPFIDLLLEVNWSSGRMMRDYTVLLDPPVARQALAPVRPTAAQTDLAPPSRLTVPAPRLARAAMHAGASDQITVQRGDTASNIAATYKPADVSLDQMLVALLRRNTDAFIGGNVNRMKSGAVLALPSDSQIRVNTPQEATSIIKAQSNDFGDYRRRLADNAPVSPSSGTERQASGKLQANVEERNAPGNSPDKLQISQGNTAADDKLAQSRQIQAENNRTAELAKNLADLKKLQAASGATSAAAASAPATPDGPAVLAVPAAPVAAVAAAPKVIAVPTLVTAPKSGFFASLLDNPLMLGVAALVTALLAFFLFRVAGRGRPGSADSVFFEAKAPHDSFFGVGSGSGSGQQVDANDRHLSVVSSTAYSTSQLDSGDVDPVAEADVYLAYGRDLQAEEILREAMRIHPERVAAPLKLLEIHAKRRDLRAFEALTGDIHKLTGGTGAEWAHAVELGRDLDPGNLLYQPAVSPPPILPPRPSPPPFVHSVTPPGFDLELPDSPGPVAQVSDTLQSTPSRESGFIEFDMASLSNPTSSLPDTPSVHLDATAHTGDHSHAITLALARELHDTGDIDGALSLIRQVASQGSGKLQVEAQQLLTQWVK